MKMTVSAIEQKIYKDTLRRLIEDDTSIDVWAEKSFKNEEFRLIFIKMINNLLVDSYAIAGDVHTTRKALNLPVAFSESEILQNHDYAKKALFEAFNAILSVEKAEKAEGKATSVVVDKKGYVIPKDLPKFKGTKKPSFNGYTTTNLADYFEVSVTTINTWINDGRFEGVTRQAHQRIRISGDTYFNAPTGARYQVKDVVEAYEEDQREWEQAKNDTIATQDQQVTAFVKFFEDKYGDTYENTLGKKEWGDLTADEESDASMWTFFLERIHIDEDSRD
ncbi:helix-turn-helix domain-containing protein [Priestia megaterium]|uniref:helix-turn-helix domain-containing protein n=1 Tax=Priestia megaterium TaxID=1404 RepID=UPI001AE0B16C|nr:helix-turn-helix domain-containing protein [Priestia megaterium]